MIVDVQSIETSPRLTLLGKNLLDQDTIFYVGLLGFGMRV